MAWETEFMGINEAARQYMLGDFFNIDQIQKIQDYFASVTGVASIITDPQGNPITSESGFSSYCSKVRKTKKGMENCRLSDAVICQPKTDGPRIHRCIGGGLYDGGASIMAGDNHIANWLIGQVWDESRAKDELKAYACEVGIPEDEVDEDISTLTHMSFDKFKLICQFLFYNAQLLSNLALETLHQKEEIQLRIQAEKKLEYSDQRYQAMINNISDVIAIIDQEGKVMYQSPNIKKWFGWSVEDRYGKSGFSVIHQDYREDMKKRFAKLIRTPGGSDTAQFRYLCKGGDFKHVNLVATNLLHDENIKGILLNYHDITESVSLEKEKEQTQALLRNQQKLESIGTLASGVAHEINNPINGIMNYSQLILDTADSSDTIEYANEIVSETKRVSTIVKNLLQFSRQDIEGSSKACVEDIINKTLSLIKTIIQKDQIELRVDVGKDLPEIKCRSQQIQQVLMNLMTNARDALNDRYAGYDKNKLLLISAAKVVSSGKDIVRITVEDRGNGIPKAMREKIFDPFFTSKDRFKGTGLGLSISYGIVAEHGGQLSFDSKEGEYTCFYIDLPAEEQKK